MQGNMAFYNQKKQFRKVEVIFSKKGPHIMR